MITEQLIPLLKNKRENLKGTTLPTVKLGIWYTITIIKKKRRPNM
jgi:hypothetical protein